MKVSGNKLNCLKIVYKYIYNFRKGISGNFAKILLAYASSQLFGNLLQLAAGLLIVHWIIPEIYGKFSGAGIFLGYLSLLHLGVLNGLNRELPVEHGRKNFDIVKHLSAVAYWVVLFIGLPSALVLSGLALHAVFTGHIEFAWVYLAYATSAFFLLLNKFYLHVLYRTNNDFEKLTKITIVLSIASIITVLLIWVMPDLKGLSVRLIILNVVEFYLLYHFRPIRVKPRWSTEYAKRLFNTGLPIQIVGQLMPLWNTLKNTIIFSLGGPLQFGYYALVNVATSTISTIPIAFSQIIYPKMAIAYGEGKSNDQVYKIAVKPAWVLFVIGIFICIGGYFLLPVTIEYLMPKYIPGMRAAMWILLFPIVSAFEPANNYFNVFEKQKQYFLAGLAGIIVSAIYIAVYYYLFGFSLELFTQSLIIGTIVQNMMCYYFIKNHIKQSSGEKVFKETFV
jgi:O-antigen/teichoic acid export membrane protein